jgi:hypothetical protein
LPYGFEVSDDKEFEADNFIHCFRELIGDIEKLKDDVKETTIEKRKTKFEELQERLAQEQEEAEFQKSRILFRLSSEGIGVAQHMMRNLIDDIKGKVRSLEKSNILIATEEAPNPQALSLKYKRYSITIGCEYNEGLSLYIGFWEGLKTLDRNSVYFPGGEPKRLKFTKYNLDRNRQGDTSWVDLSKEENFSTEELVDSSLEWLINPN